jgi:RNA polymerase sigma-70 factor (ECF subfamily)
MSKLTDSQLAARAAGGSSAAFHELVRRFERPILSLIQRMVHDPALAEDLAQETFVKAYRKLDSFDPARKLSSWLFKIAHNTTLDHLRRKHPRTVPLEAGRGEDDETWEVLPAPEEEAPDRRAERSELASGIGAALARMRPKYREVLLLRFQHGLSYEEIAEVTGVRLGTVKIQLHRARKRLAADLLAAGLAPPEIWAERASE